MILRPYQNECLAAIEGAFSQRMRRPLAALPTGAGKTVIFAELIRRRGGRALVLAHRDELIDQAMRKIFEVIPAASVGRVQADYDQHRRQIVVASVQTLARARRLERLRADFSTIVIDEAHHAQSANSYGKILARLFEESEVETLLLGVTATPDRGDKRTLAKVFDGIVYSLNMFDLIEAGYLSPLRAVQIRLNADFNRLHSQRGDYAPAELVNLLEAGNWSDHVLKAWQDHAAGRQTVIFTPSVAQAYKLAAVFQSAGIAAQAVHDKTPKAQRKALLAAFSAGRVQVVVNCGILTEGFDEPSISCVVMARPTRSRALYVQCVGRGTRLHPGKADCLLLDVVGCTTRHDLVTAASLAGVRPELVRDGADLRELKKAEQKKRIEETAEQEERERVEAEQRALEIDLLRRTPVRTAPAFRWDIHADQKQAFLAVQGHRFEISRTGPDYFYRDHQSDFEGIAEHYHAAREACEIEARRLIFGNPDAAWRRKPASSRQAALLHRFKIDFDPGLSAGAASDLLDQYFTARRRRA